MFTSSAVTSTTRAAARLNAVGLAKIVTNTAYTLGPRPAVVFLHQQSGASARSFSTTRQNHITEFFPAPESPHIKKTEAAWPHPVYTNDQMNAISVSHRDAKTRSDRVALAMVRMMRFGLDLVSGYKHGKAKALGKTDPAAAQAKYGMTAKKYLTRNVFLESVAGVPGMVAGK